MVLGMLLFAIGVATALVGCARMANDVDEAVRLLRGQALPREGGEVELGPAYGVASSVTPPGCSGNEAADATN